MGLENTFLDPEVIITDLFGNIWLFIAVGTILILYFISKYRLNMQLSILILFYFWISLGLVVSGIKGFYGFFVLFVAFALVYVIWRWIATK